MKRFEYATISNSFWPDIHFMNHSTKIGMTYNDFQTLHEVIAIYSEQGWEIKGEIFYYNNLKNVIDLEIMLQREME